MSHPVRHLLARGIAGAGGVAHRLADFNPAAAGWDRSWCGAGAGQGDADFACSGAGVSRLIDGRLKADCGTCVCRTAFTTAVIELRISGSGLCL